MIVVSNATPLINLAKINKLEILQTLFKKIVIADEVFHEIVHRGKGKWGSKEVQEAQWMTVKSVKNTLSVELLLSELDRGEAETIILAKELKADLVLIDQPKPRQIAAFGKLNVRGTLGILVQAKSKKVIPRVRPYLDELRAKGTWIGDTVYHEVLRKARE